MAMMRVQVRSVGTVKNMGMDSGMDLRACRPYALI